MARPESSLLDHPQRLAIDAALAAGKLNYSEIAARYGVSRTALFRYRASHLLPTMRAQLQGTELGDPTSLLQRLVAVADDSRQVRLALLEQGKTTAHATAASAEIRAVELLLDRLEIDSTDIAEFTREAVQLRDVVGKLVKENPRVARWLVREFRERGMTNWVAAMAPFSEPKEVES